MKSWACCNTLPRQDSVQAAIFNSSKNCLPGSRLLMMRTQTFKFTWRRRIKLLHKFSSLGWLSDAPAYLVASTFLVCDFCHGLSEFCTKQPRKSTKPLLILDLLVYHLRVHVILYYVYCICVLMIFSEVALMLCALVSFSFFFFLFQQGPFNFFLSNFSLQCCSLPKHAGH